MSTTPIEVFFSYAHKDEDLRDELAKHLTLLQRQGVISAWYDRNISAGMEWKQAIDAHLNSACYLVAGQRRFSRVGLLLRY
jgi:hypothetical protein